MAVRKNYSFEKRQKELAKKKKKQEKIQRRREKQEPVPEGEEPFRDPDDHTGCRP